MTNDPLFVVKEQILFTIKNPFVNLGWFIAVMAQIAFGVIDSFGDFVFNYIFTMIFSSIILYIIGSKSDSLKEKNQ